MILSLPLMKYSNLSGLLTGFITQGNECVCMGSFLVSLEGLVSCEKKECPLTKSLQFYWSMTRFLVGKDVNERKGKSSLTASMSVSPQPIDTSFLQNPYGPHSSRNSFTSVLSAQNYHSCRKECLSLWTPVTY